MQPVLIPRNPELARQSIIHLFLHFAVPLALATTAYRARWLQSYAYLMAGMLIDIDHLLADPIYDPGRCSVGFHPLHTLLPIVLYAVMLAHPKTRLFGLGLCIHILLDSMDCYVTNGVFYV